MATIRGRSYVTRRGEAMVELGDLYAREPKALLAEYLAQGAGDEEFDVAPLLVTAHVVTAGGGVERREIELPITLSPEDGGRVDPQVRRELLLLEAAQAREDALGQRGKGDYDGARSTLETTAERLEAEGLGDDEVAEEASDLRSMAQHFEAREVTAADAKYMTQRAYARQTSRMSAAEMIRRTESEEGEDVEE